MSRIVGLDEERTRSHIVTVLNVATAGSAFAPLTPLKLASRAIAWLIALSLPLVSAALLWHYGVNFPCADDLSADRTTIASSTCRAQATANGSDCWR